MKRRAASADPRATATVCAMRAKRSELDRPIEAHHVIDHDAVGEPVVQIGHRRERMRAGVRCTQVLLKRDRAHHRSHEHVAARLEIVAVVRTQTGNARAAMRTPSSAMPSQIG